MNMECNEEEARRAMEIADKKISENDYFGAKKFVNQAQNLYPELDGLQQVLMIIDVHISASTGGRKKETCWYEILGLDYVADDETVKKQYKKLALLLHPDKNKFNGAEGAFKLILEAFSHLSNQKKKPKESKQNETGTRKQSKPHKPASSTKPRRPKPESDSDSESKPESRYNKPEPKFEHTFWTVCNRCKTYCEYVRASYLNKTLSCPNCGYYFVAEEIIPEIINGRPVIRMSPSAVTSSCPTLFSDSTKAHKRVTRWFEPNLESDSISRKERVSTFTFWTVCNRCKTYCELVRANFLDKILPCSNCGHEFVAKEIIPEVVSGRPVIRLSDSFQSASRGRTYASSCSSSASNCARAANQAQKGVKFWFGKYS
ncbi:unnamed protein product [Microthlaspi erraticum]|uniref:J domain-containing protein n=1 Tax=Microthlaspi erraticum TaxID=1685480 RepID=A0A6D2I8K2_9BRAS|nr:unnamed protein product [Microthlaspi erraticum]